jgi:hypothetical protein
MVHADKANKLLDNIEEGFDMKEDGEVEVV